MRIVVTGTRGQLVSALTECVSPDVEVVTVGRPRLDLADPTGIGPGLADARPDVIINAAAYTAVDRAESEREAAFATNAIGAGAVATAATRLGVPLIQLSTDYVFDGRKTTPYAENDPVAPLGVYGASKLAGERAVLAAHPDAVICRTAWVYGVFGQNFVKTMLCLAETRDAVDVVADQFGNPTSAHDIASSLITIAGRLCRAGSAAPRGIFHLAGSGTGSWADLAEAVFAASAAAGGRSARVRRITAAAYPTAAPRPANSRLDCDRLRQAYGITLPAWRDSVDMVVRRLVQDPGGEISA